jgi:hypothetical protein
MLSLRQTLLTELKKRVASSGNGQDVALQCGKVDGDIETLIESRVLDEDNDNWRRLNPELKRKIVSSLKRSEGMCVKTTLQMITCMAALLTLSPRFQLVNCHLDELTCWLWKEMSPKWEEKIIEVLDHLPEKLSEVYERILKRVESEKDSAIALLK